MGEFQSWAPAVTACTSDPTYLTLFLSPGPSPENVDPCFVARLRQVVCAAWFDLLAVAMKRKRGYIGAGNECGGKIIEISSDLILSSHHPHHRSSFGFLPIQPNSAVAKTSPRPEKAFLANHAFLHSRRRRSAVGLGPRSSCSAKSPPPQL